MKRNSGFTIIELMFVVLIISIITGFAAPALQNLFERKTLPEVAKLMEKTIKLGREEARRRNTLITLSPLLASWESGWQLTYVDDTTLQETLIREFPNVPDTVSISSPQFNNANPLTMEPNGQATRVGSFEFSQSATYAASACFYTLNILISGMIQKSYSGC